MDRSALLRQLEADYRNAVEVVDRAGLAVIVGTSGPDQLPVAFSIGAARQNLPDLIVYGLPHELAAGTLNASFVAVKENWPFPSRSKFAGVLEIDKIALRDVSRSDLLDSIMGPTKLFNIRQGLAQTPILQICWPDKHGILPYEAGCDSATAAAQRVRSLRN